MDDLKLYHALHAEIAELKDELALLQYRLKCELRIKSKWKCKYRKSVGETLTTADRARLIIGESKKNGFTGSVTTECKRIAEIIGVSVGTIRTHWYDKSTH